MTVEILSERVVLHCGDCLDVLVTLPENSVHSCVTDPPYHLTSIIKRFGADNAVPPKFKTGAYGGNFDPSGVGTGAAFVRMSRGFMGKQWDGGNIAFRPETWAAVYRVLKPGGYVLAFSGARTYHRMACAIEDAGFDVRDMCAWMYGSGFPKSRNVGSGWGTALKPALEPICMARKPLIGTVAANVLEHGTGAINIDGCRVDAPDGVPKFTHRSEDAATVYGDGRNGSNRTGVMDAVTGRWPANVIHDGSEEVVGAFPETATGTLTAEHRCKGGYSNDRKNEIFGKGSDRGCAADALTYEANSGSAARFFYSAKADSNDRIGSKHPTVKPVDLMQYLCRLVTPPGGTVLDPFSGTGTTGEAAWREGFKAILIEREAEYQEDIRRRMRLVTAGPDERLHQGIRASGKTVSPGPLFDMPYNADDDFARSVDDCYAEIRDRVKKGGPGWPT